MPPFTKRFQTEWFAGVSPEREQRERELLTSGCVLPLRARCAWARVFPHLQSSLLVATKPDGTRGALGVEFHRSRALPGHTVWRVPRVGGTMMNDAGDELVAALVAAARRDRRVLRVHVESFSREGDVRERQAASLASHGFASVPNAMSYEYTLATDLRDITAEALFAKLARGIRHNVKAVSKFNVAIRRIVDVRESVRMNAVMRETLGRTGAHHDECDYAPLIQLCADEPSLAQLLGLYRTDVGGPDSLVALALGLNNGDHVTYDIGASTRLDELRGLSLGYPLLWELILWAIAQKALWFDFGGVSLGVGEDPLAGISDFKRRFANEMVRVGEEWVFSPRPARDRLAKAVSRGTVLVDSLRSRFRRRAE